MGSAANLLGRHHCLVTARLTLPLLVEGPITVPLDNHVLTVKLAKISCFVSASSHRQAAQAIGALVAISSIMAKTEMAKNIHLQM